VEEFSARMKPLPLLLSLASVAALRTPTHATPHLTRRYALSALGSALPFVVPAVCNAEFATELSDERRAVMKASAGAGLFDPNSAFKIECDRDDKECLARKREAANPFKDGVALPSSEQRSADIQRQANGCRITCGANGLRVTCDPGDTECLKKKRESSFIGAGQVPILVGGVLAAIIAQATVLRASPSENIADAPGMQEYLEGKKKRAALGPNAPDTRLSLPAAMAKMRAEAKAKKQAEAAAAAAAADGEGVDGEGTEGEVPPVPSE